MGNRKDYGSRESVFVFAALSGILVLTLLLRLYGIDWGLPTSLHPYYSYHPDEAALLQLSQWLAQGKTAVKEFIYGGTFYFVILRACTYFGVMFGESIGGFNALANAMLVARYLQVFIALLTMLLVYECGRLLYDRRTGLVAALVLVVAPAHIIATQTVRPDAISAFLVTLITLMAAKLLRSERTDQRKLLVYTGIAIGATAAFRLPMMGFGIMPAIAYIIARQRTGGGPFWKMIFDWNALWLILAIACTYVVLSPHPLMYPEAFMQGIRTTIMYETSVFSDAVDRGPIFYQYGWRLLYQALGYPAYFLTLGGVIYLLLRRHIEDRILLAGIALYFIMLSSITWTVVRYTLPILPLLALAGGVGVIRLLDRMREGNAKRILTVIAGLLLAWTLAADLALLNVVASKNVRVLSSEWITHNIPRDKSILVIKGYVEDEFFNPTIPPYHSLSAAYLFKGSDSRELFTPIMFDYLVLHELLYADMERLGSQHPRKEVREFYENIVNAKLKLVAEIKVPMNFLGVDFSGLFQAMDFSIINPGIRIYQAP